MRILTPFLIMLGALVWPSMGLAIDFNNGGWTTSFDYGQACTHGGSGGGGVINCHDIQGADNLNWNQNKGQNVSGNYTQSLVAANNGEGDGGMGMRTWNGDGTNIDSAPVRFVFPSQEPEIWLRWYQRYESAFACGSLNYDKVFYMYCATSENVGASTQEIFPQHASPGDFAIRGNGGDLYGESLTGWAWFDTFGGLHRKNRRGGRKTPG